MGNFLQLNDIVAYKRSLLLSKYVWSEVVEWNWFAKRTVGVQFVTAVDSISAIIAEGFGRHHKKDKIHFFRMARGSVTESLDWTYKSWSRKLISKEKYDHIMKELKDFPREINHLIKYTNSKLKE